MVGKTWGEGHTMAKSMSGSCLPHFDRKLPAITLKALLYSPMSATAIPCHKVSQPPKTVAPAAKQLSKHIGLRGIAHIQSINHITLPPLYP